MVMAIQTHDECLTNVQKYIRQNLDQSLDRKALADLAGFSVPHFHRLFCMAMGESMGTYVRRLRMHRAGQKLRMGAVNITEVALAAGYTTHTAFGKAFKQAFGITPSAFRQLNCFVATQVLRNYALRKEPFT